jgi:hypothetical protein
MGLSEFGDCSMTLCEEMIAHRASVFHDNSASLMEKFGYKEPPGHRAVWPQRHKLCVAKHVNELRPGMSTSKLRHLLLSQKTGKEESRFVEVHIWGPMSIRTVARVILRKGSERIESGKAFELELKDRLASVGLTLEKR